MSVVILVPVLWRPDKVAPLIDDIKAATPEPHRILFIADPDDDTELDALRAADAEWITPGPTTYPQKINAAVAVTDEPWVFLAADDLHFHSGWLTAALSVSDGFGVVGTNDGGCNPRVERGKHSVHSFVSRAYIDEHGGTVDGPGLVLHSGYRHSFCDDELVGTARRRGQYVHAHDSVVEHLHPFAGKAVTDRVYEKGQASVVADRRLFQRRRRLWAR